MWSHRDRGVLALLTVGVLAVSLPRVAGAVDGVLEINQARAMAGGVTAGDFPGFPVTIDAPGSYRLTGNLDVRNENNPQDVTAIAITANDVTLDLNGFAILGPVSCTGIPLTCPAGGGIGNGVKGTAFSTTVINGVVRGMGDVGISLDDQARVERVHASSNRSVGILVGEASILEANTADNNGGFGMQTGGGTVIRGNSVAFNGASVGIGGINAFGGSTIVHNAVYRNRGVGLNLDPDGGYGDNVLTLNNNGADNPQVAGGLQIGTNVCGTNTTCP